MPLFFKNNQNNDNRATQATLFSKTMTAVVTASLINMMAMPAYANNANHANGNAQNSQTLVGDNAYDKIVNLTAKYELEQQAYQEQREQQLAKRNLFSKAVDGVVNTVKSVFSDSVEVEKLTDLSTLKQSKQQLLQLQSILAEEQDTLNEELEQQTQQMQQAGFSSQDLAEHQQLIETINQRYHTLNDLFEQLKNTTDDSQALASITAINQRLNEWQPETRQTDVENLPWGMPDSEVREPIVSESDANKAFAQKTSTQMSPLPFQGGVRGGYSDNSPYSAIEQWRNTEYKIGQILLDPHLTSPLSGGGTKSSGFIKTGGLSGTTDAGQWTVLNALPAEVQPADLAENEDVQITEAIKTKAKELDNNPAKIYKWVHDNIVYVPSYGSIQGSDYTLQTKRGNSFDTASLLIALLRASDIPARYVYGTVEIPAKQAMDWVGGVHNISAVQNLLGQGGVPNTAVMSGSVPKYLRLEHVWVEANINFVSKGSANNKSSNTNKSNSQNNQNNQWLPLDASYKSYIRTEGIDLAKAVPFDAEELINKAKEGATIDEATGSVQNLNQGAVNQAIEDYQAQVQQYLEENHADATVGDVLGTSKIKAYKSSMLSPVLPYKVKTVVSDYQELPEKMRHYFIINVFQDIYERKNTIALGDNPNFHVKIPTVKLQGKPLALSFKPASKADEDKITNSLPKPDENGEIDPTKIPTGFPRNVGMTAEVTLGDEVLKTGNHYGFATEVQTQLGFQAPNTGINYSINTANRLSDKLIRAGEYHAIGYDMQGLSQKQLENTKNTLEDAKAKLEQFQNTEDETVLASLTKHDISGAMLQAVVQSYFAINDVQDTIAVQQNKQVVANRFMSYGTFHTFVKPNMRYGISFGGRFTGMQMDIDRLLRQGVAKDNQLAKLANFNASQGARQSANEHLVPEQLFDNPETEEKEVEGISAVKALQIASEQGQEIITITKENYDKAIAKISLDSGAMEDIHNAIRVGKTVTTHANSISYKGWHGSGYIILDERTGTGAYLISGGANGAMFAIFGAWISALIVSTFWGALTGALATGGIGLAGIAVVLPLIILQLSFVILSIKSMSKTLAKSKEEEKFLWGCFKTGMLFGLNGSLIGFDLSKKAQFANLIFGGLFSVPSASECVTGWTV